MFRWRSDTRSLLDVCSRRPAGARCSCNSNAGENKAVTGTGSCSREAGGVNGGERSEGETARRSSGQESIRTRRDSWMLPDRSVACPPSAVCPSPGRSGAVRPFVRSSASDNHRPPQLLAIDPCFGARAGARRPGQPTPPPRRERALSRLRRGDHPPIPTHRYSNAAAFNALSLPVCLDSHGAAAWEGGDCLAAVCLVRSMKHSIRRRMEPERTYKSNLVLPGPLQRKLSTASGDRRDRLLPTSLTNTVVDA